MGYSCADGNHTASTKFSNSLDIHHLLTTFLTSDLRSQKHLSINTYDTPAKLAQNCSTFGGSTSGCSSYKYDTTIWISTIIDEWNLVCGRAWLISWTQSLYMGGFIVSYLVFGYLSDRFGRKKSLLIGGLVEILAGLGCTFSTSIYMFLVFRFLVGFGCAGRSSSSYLIMVEWVGPKWRVYISTLGSLGWLVGYCSMPWIAAYFLHFRHMQLFVCLYETFIIIWLIWLPESPRWLLTHKRFDQAYQALLTAAKFNGLIKKDSGGTPTKESVNFIANKLSQPSLNLFPQAETSSGLQAYSMAEFDSKFEHLRRSVEMKGFSQNEDKLSIFDLFKWKNLRWYAMILFFVWSANSLIYYGIALNVGNFGGSNLFIAFTIAGFTELPSMIFSIVCMSLLPRKTTNILLYSLVGLLCAVQFPLKYYHLGLLQQTTMMLAKLFNTCAFAVVLYQTMELFPTSIRQTAYSSCSLAGRFGSILAPFIKDLNNATNEYVCLALFVTLSCVTSLLINRLPETKGSDFSDTLREAEEFEGTRPHEDKVKDEVHRGKASR